MLKSIAMACGECTTKHEKKASYNTDYIVPDLRHRLKKEIFIFVKNVLLIKNWFIVSEFSEYLLRHIEKCLVIYIFYSKPKLNSLLSEFFSYQILQNSSTKKIFCQESTSLSLFRGVIFSNRLKAIL